MRFMLSDAESSRSSPEGYCRNASSFSTITKLPIILFLTFPMTAFASGYEREAVSDVI